VPFPRYNKKLAVLLICSRGGCFDRLAITKEEAPHKKTKLTKSLRSLRLGRPGILYWFQQLLGQTIKVFRNGRIFDGVMDNCYESFRLHCIAMHGLHPDDTESQMYFDLDNLMLHLLKS
jgi:hypothetical protein